MKPFLSSNNSNKPIAVTMGDPLGIGIDCVFAALLDNSLSKLPDFIWYAEDKVILERAQRLGITAQIISLETNITKRAIKIAAKTNNRDLIIPIKDIRGASGLNGDSTGVMAADAIHSAAKDVKSEEVSAMVTSPIQKSSMIDAGWQWQDHTTFLSEIWNERDQDDLDDGREVTMLFVSDKLKLALCTVHVPVLAVSSLITINRVYSHLIRLNNALINNFNIKKPSIGVCGLNPHAGEAGKLGDEEINCIVPAMQKARNEGIAVEGPFAADGLFFSDNYAQYDAILAMYHDQGLVGVKAVSGYNLAQTTIGTPYVRTSPGHGTARSIAGSGKADYTGFVSALKLAAQMIPHKYK